MSQDDMQSYDFTQIPFEKIVRVGQRTLLHRDLFCVSWLLGRYCNFSCSYCWPYASSKIKDHRPLSILVSTMDEIKRQARQRGLNSFHFSFSGGEPTLHKSFLDLLAHYSSDFENSNFQSTHMTTNLSPGISWFKKYVGATKNLHRVSVTASYHKEFIQKERFAEKLIFLQESDVRVTINMVMVPEKFDELWADANYFHEKKINVTLKPQSNLSATKIVDGYEAWMLEKLQKGLPQMEYTHYHRKGQASLRPQSPFSSLKVDPKTSKNIPAVMQVELTDDKGQAWYIDQAERFNAFEFNQFKGWECSSGYRSIIIREPDGHIKRSYSCGDEPLGHIEKGFKLFDKPMPCITDNCVSSADSKIPKRKAGTDLSLWKTTDDLDDV